MAFLDRSPSRSWTAERIRSCAVRSRLVSSSAASTSRPRRARRCPSRSRRAPRRAFAADRAALEPLATVSPRWRTACPAPHPAACARPPRGQDGNVREPDAQAAGRHLRFRRPVGSGPSRPRPRMGGRRGECVRSPAPGGGPTPPAAGVLHPLRCPRRNAVAVPPSRTGFGVCPSPVRRGSPDPPPVPVGRRRHHHHRHPVQRRSGRHGTRRPRAASGSAPSVRGGGRLRARRTPAALRQPSSRRDPHRGGPRFRQTPGSLQFRGSGGAG